MYQMSTETRNKRQQSTVLCENNENEKKVYDDGEHETIGLGAVLRWIR